VAQGDNNRVDDRGLYAPGQQWLNREDILGRASGTFVCVRVHGRDICPFDSAIGSWRSTAIRHIST